VAMLLLQQHTDSCLSLSLQAAHLPPLPQSTQRLGAVRATTRPAKPAMGRAL
jgi:hypothetical protein